MDGLAVGALCRDWNHRLTRARIEKIHQPADRDLVLTVRSPDGSSRLLLSAHRQFARAHALYGRRPDNPAEPPMFCMLLRKRLESGRILGVRQQGLDRVIEIRVESQNEVGDTVCYVLVVEIMGKHSNILLCTADETGSPVNVVDSIVRVTPQMSRVRPVLPGLPYCPAPPQDKYAAADLDAAAIAALDLIGQSAAAQVKSLSRHIAGCGPVTAREILHRAGPDLAPERVAATVRDLYKAALSDDESSSMGLDALGRSVAAAPFLLTSFERYTVTEHLDQALEAVYAETVQMQRQSAAAVDLTRVVDAHLDKLRGKQAKLQEMLVDNQDDASPRICGDLLTAYAHQVEKGETEVELPNFYDDERPLRIELQPALSPIENAQRYYKLSSKRKRSIPILSSELEATERDLAYLAEVRAHLEDATTDTLEEIRTELVQEGFLQARRKSSRAAKKTAPAGPQTYRSVDGFIIRVGRDNLQNDQLTFRRSRPDDLWFHVKVGPGSHVVVSSEGREIPESTIADAALLAAWFSKSRDSANVAVDCTEIRHVRKPANARPGFALYEHYRTYFATPDRLTLGPLLERIERR